MAGALFTCRMPSSLGTGDRIAKMRVPLKFRIARWIGHQHYIPRGRDRIIRSFAKPGTAAPFSVDFFGYNYRGDLRDYIDWSVYVYGAYSRGELDLLAAVASALRCDGPVNFYDVGANVGQHTLFMSRFADWVVAFEPFGPVRERLQRQIADNGIGNVQVFPFALGASDEERPFKAPPDWHTGTGSFRDAQDGPPLPVRRGDAILAEQKLPPIGILKVDVEGFEAEVFDGLRERLRRDRPVILTEVSGADRSGFRTFDRFAAALYDDFEYFAVGCTSISGTYRIMPPSFRADGEFLIVPKEKLVRLRPILRQTRI
jgi:FkbM family methyltransferase